MIGIYVICFLIFPISVLIQAEKAAGTDALLKKEDTDTVKGIAVAFVILAHLVNDLQADGMEHSLLQIYTVTGGMGVLLFFFVSGYGIYKSYGHRKPDIRDAQTGKSAAGVFLYKRFRNTYLPCVWIQFTFCLLDSLQTGHFSWKEALFESLLGAWFVDVILIQYLIFCLSWILAKERQGLFMALNLLFSILAAVIFYLCGLNARWYNGLLMFPVGMLVAWQEPKLLLSMRKRWLIHLGTYFTLFLFWGGILLLEGKFCYR
ncbi:MAG: acyltransferase [Blautia sp.]|nr:acyltransferase [Lachnoclostridium sp.]MCM1212197.1 acyltransferase [Blautia sp.]